MAYCGKCLHLDVCKTAETCDGHVPRCKHFMDKDEHPKLKHGQWERIGEADYKCSVCGFRFTSGDPITMFPFCRCGARMDGDGHA